MLEPTHREIFAALPPHRPVTAGDVFNRVRGVLPPGWHRGDVVQAMCKFARLGDVAVEKIEGVNIYTRFDNKFPKQGKAQ